MTVESGEFTVRVGSRLPLPVCGHRWESDGQGHECGKPYAVAHDEHYCRWCGARQMVVVAGGA